MRNMKLFYQTNFFIQRIRCASSVYLESSSYRFIFKKQKRSLQQANVGLLSWCSSEWISCMIEQSFVQFSKQFTRIENRTFGRASWSVLDDYVLFQSNYNKRKMGYIAVKIWLSPNSSRETHGYTITATESTTKHRASPCYAKKWLIKTQQASS